MKKKTWKERCKIFPEYFDGELLRIAYCGKSKNRLQFLCSYDFQYHHSLRLLLLHVNSFNYKGGSNNFHGLTIKQIGFWLACYSKIVQLTVNLFIILHIYFLGLMSSHYNHIPWCWSIWRYWPDVSFIVSLEKKKWINKSFGKINQFF